MDRIVHTLVDDGWREYPDGLRKYARCFFKRFPAPTRCRCNPDKDGMQVCCAVSELHGRVSYELELCGELQDGTWVRLHQWSMPEDIAQGLAVVIPRLLATWEHIAGAALRGGECMPHRTADEMDRNAITFARDLERELALNATMLAKQCDLARQAEAERDEARAARDRREQALRKIKKAWSDWYIGTEDPVNTLRLIESIAVGVWIEEDIAKESNEAAGGT